jgi:putative FmdB family regulatory protein
VPAYEFNCKKCEKSLVVVKSIHEDTKTAKCDTCNSDMTRVYSSVGVTFNGSGFYRTDNRGS